MSAESGWAVAVGAAAGIFSWVVGLGKFLWPNHPQWALSLITAGVTILALAILGRHDRRRTKLAHS
jgi:hypothetical protein